MNNCLQTYKRYLTYQKKMRFFTYYIEKNHVQSFDYTSPLINFV
ncbi:MAG: hypothetical protein BWY22_00146 [Bacteroidetes bacterium ADurb.Bin217]|nr:MAG: hypothetical protein BWY22_00146 [Bacteroidetes bacterium ADurb.Bin217]